MKVPFWMKLIGLALLSFTTVLVTSALIRTARGQGRPRELAIPFGGIATVSAGPTTKGKPAAATPFVPGPNQIAHGHMKSTSATVAGHEVSIAAEAYLFDRRKGVEFIWSLRIYDSASNALMFKRDYTEQPFTVNGERSPTFHETVTLAPGFYKITPIVVSTTGMDDPTILDDPQAITPYVMLGGVRTVRIP